MSSHSTAHVHEVRGGLGPTLPASQAYTAAMVPPASCPAVGCFAPYSVQLTEGSAAFAHAVSSDECFSVKVQVTNHHGNTAALEHFLWSASEAVWVRHDCSEENADALVQCFVHVHGVVDAQRRDHPSSALLTNSTNSTAEAECLMAPPPNAAVPTFNWYGGATLNGYLPPGDSANIYPIMISTYFHLKKRVIRHGCQVPGNALDS